MADPPSFSRAGFYISTMVSFRCSMPLHTELCRKLRDCCIAALATPLCGTLFALLLAAMVSRAQQPQPPLQITSPEAGAIVNPGEILTVRVASPAGLKFSMVSVLGENRIGMSPTVATTLPSEFALTIPSDLPCGPRGLEATGVTASGQNIDSDPIMIDVERPDFPVSLTGDVQALYLETQGETSAIQLFATYRGREVLDVTDSSYIAYSSSNPAVATVNTSGEVTAVAAGDASIVATYTLGSQSYPLFIPVNVQHPKLTIAPSSLAFAPQAIGTTGSSQLVTLTNLASYPVKIFSVTS